MLDDATKKRFEDALASGKLQELCDLMISEGASQVDIYESFYSFWLFLGDKNREGDYEALADALERIVGWCSPGVRWFDHYLSNEEIYAHQSGLTEEQVHEISALVLKDAPNEIFCGFRREPNGELVIKTARIQAGTFHVGKTYSIGRLENGWQINEQKSDHCTDSNDSSGPFES
jgi:hypothetical protein